MSDFSVKIDFQVIDSKDPKVLMIADTSEWQHIENKPAIVEVTLPGDSNHVTHYLTKGGLSVLNSINLMINCTTCGNDVEKVDLEDGIYKITIKGSPSTHFKTKNYLRTTKFKLELAKFLCDIDAYKNKSTYFDVLFLLNSAEANAIYGNMSKASTLFNKAHKLLDSAKCN